MNIQLDPIEARIIGSLMEKSMITPDQYPLSLNALVSACNQKSSREPVMDLGEGQVRDALQALQQRYLVREKSAFGSRVPRYHYRVYNDEIGDFRFSAAERALVCLLLLRGPQTSGELRSRAGRMHPFADAEEVESVLEGLMHYQEGPFVTRLPREPGRREARYAHLFGGEVEAGQAEPAPGAPAGDRAATPRQPAPLRPEPAGMDVADRLARLEGRVEALEAALAALLESRDPP